MHIHKNHHLRESPIFIDAGRAKYLHKFALTRYCWTSTTYTPYFVGIPLHVMLMPDIELLKAAFDQHTRDIVQEIRNYLNERNIGEDYTKLDALLTK